MGPQDVLRFWYEEHGRDDWFAGRPDFDAAVAARFADTHAALARGEGFSWRRTPEGRVAEIIVLDQFSRQLYRADARAFAQDGAALALAQEAVAQGLDTPLHFAFRLFLYMPYMHSESLLVHDEAGPLFASLGQPETLDYETAHRETIARFGRYPYRNRALGRVSTPEELAYIEQHGPRGF
jgi:uncharacterized protein (DUF924 family)